MKLIKACQNDNCDSKHKKITCSVTDKFCMKCGQPLFHVCSQCGAVLETDLEKLCPTCIQKNEEAKQKNKELAIDAVKTVVSTGGAAVVAAMDLVPKLPDVFKQGEKLIKKK